MSVYRLHCVLRFKTGHAGVAFDTVEIGAANPEAAVALAEMYRCSTHGMDLSVAVLINVLGQTIWSRRASDWSNIAADRLR